MPFVVGSGVTSCRFVVGPRKNALHASIRETYGVIAYQEQVMRIARELSGFTLGEADILRKAMGKKNPEVMANMRGTFVDGARKKGPRRR